MKKKTGKMILLTGVLCILSLAVCACGKKEEASDIQEPQVVQGEPIPEDDTEDDASKKAWLGMKAYYGKQKRAAKKQAPLEQHIRERLSEGELSEYVDKVLAVSAMLEQRNGK